MSKTLSLYFAMSSIILMIVTAVFISENGWYAALFAVLTCVNVGIGFIVKARKRRASSNKS
ncbi:MAG: hypothetical protein P0Y55_12735 [Candidatus Cohnella colombiensis]|uniref:Uncharacterized protein n=1 Tax=Candidatus Cohnella colombiensis TaxID=3121368 RepID=A0AA95EUH4_9BACL|nr:MAG: hypothetical protein P0Y55_12735 [Cohnella sp.]